MVSLEEQLADGKVGLVAITHMSNVLGTVVPAARVAALAHRYGARVLFDGSQAVVHRAVDVRAIDADFYVWDRAQAVWADGDRRAVCQAGAAGRDAAVHGGRRHDRERELRAQHLGAGAAQVRGGDADDPGGDRSRRGHRVDGDDRLRCHRGA